MDVTFKDLSIANLKRLEATWHPLADFSDTDWACCVSGEWGEACELIKKRRRGETILTVEIAKELADTVIYLDLLAQRLGIDLGLAIMLKFNEVSKRVGSPVRIED